MKHTHLLVAACCCALVTVAHARLQYAREVVLELSYGTNPQQVRVVTPKVGASDATAVGPNNFEVVGDSLVYIGDSANGKVKRFRIGAGLEMMTEGVVDCDNGFAIAGDGRVFVEGALGRRDITVFDSSGRRVLEVPDVVIRLRGQQPEWTGERIEQVATEAQEAGLNEPPRLRDARGVSYVCERQHETPFAARLVPKDPARGAEELECLVEVDALPDTLKDVQGVNYWMMDEMGRVYAVCYAPKSQPKVIARWEGRRPLDSRSDVVILIYGAQTRELLGAIRFDYPPIASYYNVAKVMPNGNIYRYNFTAEGLEIVRYRPIEE